jgi:excisionase family DNA binding protein
MSANDDTTALFVRLPAEHAARLDRAAAAVPTRKKDLIAGLVDRYVDPETPAGLRALRELAAPRRVVVDLGGDHTTVGHAAFRPAEPPEVLTAAQAAELLGVEERAVAELVDAGELPGRRIAGAWRFSRQAILDWLAGG